jgi:hypothetical protein
MELIENAAQLHGALEQVASFTDTLEAIRRHSLETSSTLLPAASEPYIKRIQEVNREIREYLDSSTDSTMPAKLERIAS